MFFLIPIPFLAVGCVCFIVCAAIPPARRFALASSLWFAAWGVILMVAAVAISFIVLGADSVRSYMRHGMGTSLFNISDKWTAPILIALLLATAAASAPVAIFHGVIMRRITFQLFRLYLGAVALGVGLLVASPLSLWLVSLLPYGQLAHLFIALPLIPLFAFALAWFCFSYAPDFRGRRPDALNPIAPEEYAR